MPLIILMEWFLNYLEKLTTRSVKNILVHFHDSTELSTFKDRYIKNGGELNKLSEFVKNRKKMV